jgi:hypothetical protein
VPSIEDVNLPLGIMNYISRRDDLGGVEVIALPFLTSAVDGVEWSASRPGSFISGERALGTHWI